MEYFQNVFTMCPVGIWALAPSVFIWDIVTILIIVAIHFVIFIFLVINIVAFEPGVFIGRTADRGNCSCSIDNFKVRCLFLFVNWMFHPSSGYRPPP
jgi:hypothetical protein